MVFGPGGRDFRVVEVPTREHLVRVAAAGSKVVAVGLGGTVIRADDPRGPWERVPVPVFGWLAARYSREKIMLLAAVSIAITSLPFFALLHEVDITLIFIIRTFIVLFGVAFSAPFHAWAQAQVPSEHRYFLISFAYALGSQILGGPTALISLWLFKVSGTAPFASIYWLFLSLMMSFILFRMMAIDPLKRRTSVELTRANPL